MIRWLIACLLALCCSLAAGCDRSVPEDAGPKASSEETQASRDAKRHLDAIKTSLTNARDSIVKAQQSSGVTAKPSTNTTPNQTATTNKRTSTNAPPRQASGGSRRQSQGATRGQSPNTNRTNTQNPTPPIPGNTPASFTTSEALSSAINTAIEHLKEVDSPLGSLQKTLASPSETHAKDKSSESIEKSVDEAGRKLEAARGALTNSDENPSVQRTNLNKSLDEALDLLNNALNEATNVKIPNDLKPSSTWLDSLLEVGSWVGIVLGSILCLLLLIAAGRALAKSSAARADTRIKTKIQPLAASMQKQQAEVASQIADLTSSQSELCARVAELEFEIKRVARIARETANDGAGDRPLHVAPTFSSFEEPAARDEPGFPISIGDYLSKMQRSSNIVRPDFQNDILVSDPGGTGELVLIRDTAISDDLQPLFIVPRATQFQTKQDFYTYYQKYYECARPAAGDVWIIDPAVVSRVSGGWQLREKGVLEVR